jgi:hypothetical protein
MMGEMNAKMDANMMKMAAIRSKLEETMERQTKHLMMARWTTYQETTEIHPDTEMQSVDENQEVPSENAVVKSVKERKKLRRGRNSTAERRGEPKELTRGNCESRRKLAAACRKVSRHATVA